VSAIYYSYIYFYEFFLIACAYLCLILVAYIISTYQWSKILWLYACC